MGCLAVWNGAASDASQSVCLSFLFSSVYVVHIIQLVCATCGEPRRLSITGSTAPAFLIFLFHFHTLRTLVTRSLPRAAVIRILCSANAVMTHKVPSIRHCLSPPASAFECLAEPLGSMSISMTTVKGVMSEAPHLSVNHVIALPSF